MRAGERLTYPARAGYHDPLRYEARRYGTRRGRLNLRLLLRAIRRTLPPLPRGASVLDVPCGGGVLTPLLADGHRVTGADISATMLGAAWQRGGLAACVQADIERLPFRSASFDLVVCNRFLMHLPDQLRPQVLRELGRVARGPVVVTICHRYTLKSFTRALRARLGLRVKPSPRLGSAELAREVQAAGLHLRRIIYTAPFLSEVAVVLLGGA
jgi:SAM-dependent methyltransferase